MKTEYEKMHAGEPYNCADPNLMSRWLEAKELTRQYNYHIPKHDSARVEELLTNLLGGHGEGTTIAPPFHVDYGTNIHLGRCVEINVDCCLLDCNRIEIGDHSGLGPGVHIYTVGHPLDPAERLSGGQFWNCISKPVKIGENVWIGGRAVILPGVEIGDGATVAAGSVVTKSVPPRVLVAGNPARIIRELGGKGHSQERSTSATGGDQTA